MSISRLHLGGQKVHTSAVAKPAAPSRSTSPRPQGVSKRIQLTAKVIDDRGDIDPQNNYTVAVAARSVSPIPPETPLKPGTPGTEDEAVAPPAARVLMGSCSETIPRDPKSGEKCGEFAGHGDQISALAATIDGKQIISSSFDATLRIWSLETKICERVLLGHTARVTSILLSPDNSRIISGSLDRTVIVWNKETGAIEAECAGFTGMANSLCVTRNGRFICGAGEDNTVMVWNLRSGVVHKVLEGHTAFISSVALASSSQRLISGSFDDTIIIWDLEKGSVLKMMKGHKSKEASASLNTVYSIKLSPNGKFITSIRDDCTILLWSVKKRRVSFVLKGHTDRITTVLHTQDSSFVVSASCDTSVKIWNSDNGSVVSTLIGHTDRISDISLARNGNRILSASDDGFVGVWNFDSRQLIRRIGGDDGPVTALLLLPDDKYFVCGVGAGDDAVVKVDTVVSEEINDAIIRYENFFNQREDIVRYPWEDNDRSIFNEATVSQILSDVSADSDSVLHHVISDDRLTFFRECLLKNPASVFSKVKCKELLLGKMKSSLLDKIGKNIPSVKSDRQSDASAIQQDTEVYPEAVQYDRKKYIAPMHAHGTCDPLASLLRCGVVHESNFCVREILLLYSEFLTLPLDGMLDPPPRRYISPDLNPHLLPFHTNETAQVASATGTIPPPVEIPEKTLHYYELIDVADFSHVAKVNKFSGIFLEFISKLQIVPNYDVVSKGVQRAFVEEVDDIEETIRGSSLRAPHGFWASEVTSDSQAPNVTPCIVPVRNIASKTSSFLQDIVDVVERKEKYDVFRNEVVRAVVIFKWQAFAKFYFYIDFSLYLLFFTVHIINSLVFTKHYLRNRSTMNAAVSHGMFGIQSILLVYFLAHEASMLTYYIRQYQSAYRYFYNLWNLLVASALGLVVFSTFFQFIMIFHTNRPEHDKSEETYIGFSAISCPVLAVYMLFYMQGEAKSGALVRMIIKIVEATVTFIVILVIITIGFSASISILFEKPGDDFDSYSRLDRALVSSFATMMGDFSFADMHDSRSPAMSTILLIFYLAFVSIILLNLLIAIMGDTYNDVQQNADAESLYARSLLVLRYEMVLPKRMLKDEWFPTWLQVLRNKYPEDNENQDSITLQHKINVMSELIRASSNALKKEVVRSVNDIGSKLGSNVSLIRAEIDGLNTRVERTTAEVDSVIEDLKLTKQEMLYHIDEKIESVENQLRTSLWGIESELKSLYRDRRTMFVPDFSYVSDHAKSDGQYDTEDKDLQQFTSNVDKILGTGPSGGHLTRSPVDRRAVRSAVGWDETVKASEKAKKAGRGEHEQILTPDVSFRLASDFRGSEPTAVDGRISGKNKSKPVTSNSSAAHGGTQTELDICEIKNDVAGLKTELHSLKEQLSTVILLLRVNASGTSKTK